MGLVQPAFRSWAWCRGHTEEERSKGSGASEKRMMSTRDALDAACKHEAQSSGVRAFASAMSLAHQPQVQQLVAQNHFGLAVDEMMEALSWPMTVLQLGPEHPTSTSNLLSCTGMIGYRPIAWLQELFLSQRPGDQHSHSSICPLST